MSEPSNDFEKLSRLGLTPKQMASLVDRACKDYVAQMGTPDTNPLVREVYRTGETYLTVIQPCKSSVFTRELNCLYDIQSRLLGRYPMLGLQFHVVSKKGLTEENLAAMKEKWVPKGKRVFCADESPPPGTASDQKERAHDLRRTLGEQQ